MAIITLMMSLMVEQYIVPAIEKTVLYVDDDDYLGLLERVNNFNI